MASKLKLTELLYPTSTTPAITINADDTVTFGAPTTTFTNISYSGTLTGGTGVVNIGSGQIYKDASGNVGIGTSSPNVANISGTALTVNNSDQAIFEVNRAGSRAFYNYINSDGSRIAEFRNLPMTFFTNDTERARLDSSGNLLVGTTGAFNSVNGVGVFKSGGNWQLLALRNTGAGNGSMINVSTATTAGIGWDTGVEGAGAINWSWRYDANTKATINSSTGAYTAVSDISKKKNLEASSIGLDAVMNIEPTLFHMNDDADNAPKHLGFIAQQIQPLIPQAYVENNGFIGLQDRPIIAALVKAIQEQQALIQELTTRLTALEGN
jgi:hypothetical protein